MLEEDLKQNSITVKNDLVVILSEIVTDTRVSACAVRIYCYLASRVGCWAFYNHEIKKALGIKSDHSIAKYFKELIDCGYVSRTETKENGKFCGYQYNLTVCQKMTIGENETNCKNTLKNEDKNRMSKNDNRLFKEEKEKDIKEKEEYYNKYNNINNNIKEKINKKEKIYFKATNEIDLEFVRFLEYRKKIKKPYKNQQSVELAYRKFCNMCEGSIETARTIVDTTIQNQWQGLFPVRNTTGSRRFDFNTNSSMYDVGVKA